MAREEDLKRVELKVSVNCCEGCKRKVLKALSIKGVLRTEIQANVPKVTVVGNVDVKVLIKKLSKVGKSAEILPEETQEPQGKEKCSEAVQKKSDESSKKGKEEEGSGSAKSKPQNENNPNSTEGKSKSSSNVDDNSKGQESEKNPKDSAKTTAPETTKSLNPTTATTKSMIQDSEELMASQARVYYPMEPVAVPIPYYAMNAYPAPAPYLVKDHCYYEMPLYRAPPSTTFNNYYNDEDDSVGCRIM